MSAVQPACGIDLSKDLLKCMIVYNVLICPAGSMTANIPDTSDYLVTQIDVHVCTDMQMLLWHGYLTPQLAL